MEAQMPFSSSGRRPTRIPAEDSLSQRQPRWCPSSPPRLPAFCLVSDSTHSTARAHSTTGNIGPVEGGVPGIGSRDRCPANGIANTRPHPVRRAFPNVACVFMESRGEQEVGEKAALRGSRFLGPRLTRPPHPKAPNTNPDHCEHHVKEPRSASDHSQHRA